MEKVSTIQLAWEDLLGHKSSLGFGACRLCFISAFLLAFSVADFAPTSVLYLVAASILTSVAVICFQLLRDDKEDSVDLKGKTLLVAFVLQVLGLLLVSVGPPFDLPRLSCCGFALCGIGGSYTWMLWLKELTLLNEGTMLWLSILSVFVASLVAGICYALHVSLIMIALMFSLIAYVCLRYQYLKPPDSFKTEAFSERLGFHALTFLPKAIACVLLLLFALTLAYNISFLTFLSPYATVEMRFANYVFACILLGLIVLLSNRTGVITVCRVMVPLVALSFFLIGILPTELVPFCVSLAEVPLVFTQLFLWLMLIRMVHGVPRKALVIMASGVLVVSTARMICCILARQPSFVLFSMESSTLRLILLILLLLVVLFVLPSGWKYVETSRIVSSSAEDAFVAICGELAAAYDLTSREKEVFNQVAKGFSQGIIAQNLFISEGTVHVHLAHIYRKANVHGKQELLAVIHSAVEERQQRI